MECGAKWRSEIVSEDMRRGKWQSGSFTATLSQKFFPDSLPLSGQF